MIACRDLVEQLMDFNSDQLSAEWRESIEQHCAVLCNAWHTSKVTALSWK
jgi:hypothetical protein